MRLYSIASGSSGNCIYVESSSTKVLVDAGVTAKRIELGLEQLGISVHDLDAILVTHEHIDHVRGLEIITKKYSIPVYGTQETLLELSRNFRNRETMEPLFHYIKPGESFSIGMMEVQTFSISHDARNPIGYSFCVGEEKIGMATDLGTYNDEIINRLSNAQILYLEANYDLNMLMAGAYPYQLKLRIASDRGHLSNEESSDLITKLLHEGLRHVVLAHMSKENNYAELAYETVRQAVNQNWLWDAPIPIVTVANRDIPTDPVDTE